jgi:hypothetical protein
VAAAVYNLSESPSGPRQAPGRRPAAAAAGLGHGQPGRSNSLAGSLAGWHCRTRINVTFSPLAAARLRSSQILAVGSESPPAGSPIRKLNQNQQEAF